MDGNRCLAVVDEEGRELRDVLVIPLYSQFYGIGFVPEGQGYHTKESFTVTRPFRFSSGEDFMDKKMKTRGIVLLSLAFIGKTNYVGNWLFIKKGYSPRLVRCVDVYGENPIVLKKAFGNENVILIINALTNRQQEQSFIKNEFGVEDLKDHIKVLLNADDIALLENYK